MSSNAGALFHPIQPPHPINAAPAQHEGQVQMPLDPIVCLAIFTAVFVIGTLNHFGMSPVQHYQLASKHWKEQMHATKTLTFGADGRPLYTPTSTAPTPPIYSVFPSFWTVLLGALAVLTVLLLCGFFCDGFPSLTVALDDYIGKRAALPSSSSSSGADIARKRRDTGSGNPPWLAKSADGTECVIWSETVVRPKPLEQHKPETILAPEKKLESSPAVQNKPAQLSTATSSAAADKLAERVSAVGSAVSNDRRSDGPTLPETVSRGGEGQDTSAGVVKENNSSVAKEDNSSGGVEVNSSLVKAAAEVDKAAEELEMSKTKSRRLRRERSQAHKRAAQQSAKFAAAVPEQPNAKYVLRRKKSKRRDMLWSGSRYAQAGIYLASYDERILMHEDDHEQVVDYMHNEETRSECGF